MDSDPIVSTALIVTETRPIAVGARHFRNTAGRYFDLYLDFTLRALLSRPGAGKRVGQGRGSDRRDGDRAWWGCPTDDPPSNRRALPSAGVECKSEYLCVHQIEMSPSVPFRNVTAVGVGRRAGAEPRRSAAPDRRPTHGGLQPHRLFDRAGVSPLG